MRNQQLETVIRTHTNPFYPEIPRIRRLSYDKNNV